MALEQILLCDEDLFFAQTLMAHITRCLSAHAIGASVEHCSTASALLRSLSWHEADLPFLDLALSDCVGYPLAEQLCRQHLKAEIIFGTSHADRMPDAFPYRPIGFLSKPINHEKIEATPDHLLFFYYHEDTCYTVSTRDTDLRIPPNDILYLESSAHRVTFQRDGDQEPVYQIRRLDGIDQELHEYGFVRAHQSFLVRLEAIARVDRGNICAMLTDGRDLPIVFAIQCIYLSLLDSLLVPRCVALWRKSLLAPGAFRVDDGSLSVSNRGIPPFAVHHAVSARAAGICAVNGHLSLRRKPDHVGRAAVRAGSPAQPPLSTSSSLKVFASNIKRSELLTSDLASSYKLKMKR